MIFNLKKVRLLHHTRSIADGIPSPNPDYPQPIQNVSGDITISVSDESHTNSQEVVFPLAENQKLMEGDYLADDGVHHVRIQIDLADLSYDYQADAYCRSSVIENIKANLNSKCTIAEVELLANLSKTDMNKYAIQSTGRLWFRVPQFENQAQFKQYLVSQKENGTPVILEYELARETLETFTEAQATKFEEIKSLTGYNNITIVDAISSSLTPNLSFDYYAKGR